MHFLSQGKKVSYREYSSENPKFDILFLHGLNFNSETWATEPVLALQSVQALGYRGVAIDLPGKSVSVSCKI